MTDVTQTFTDAIFVLLGRFGDALKSRGAPPNSIRAYIFGGCAVHLYVQQRISSDLDLEVDAAVLPNAALYDAKEDAGYVLVSIGEDSSPGLLEIDRNYNSTLGPLHFDFEDRATKLELQQGSPLVVLLPSREDLALSKLGRLSEVDIGDIQALMSHESASWELLMQLTKEAQAYYVGPADLTAKLQFVINKTSGATP